jgi:putative ABC transport system permease protein
MYRLINVTKKYLDHCEEDVTALDHVTIKLPRAGLLIISGTSGCGKTTLLNILGGLDKPTSGEVYFENERIDNKDEKWWDAFRGNNIGFIYQDFNTLDDMTVAYNISLPLILHGVNKSEANEKTEKVSKELGIDKILNKKCSKLSGGQKQRVAIARALITGNRVILADEPTGNLDEENSIKVFEILKDISKNHLVIVVTHDYTLGKRFADKVIKIAYGQVQEESEHDFEQAASNQEYATYVATDKIPVENSKRQRLPSKECARFALTAIKNRKIRCIMSILIFSITMSLILLLGELINRDDSKSFSNELKRSDSVLVPVYESVPYEYSELTNDDKITYGRKFYEILYNKISEGAILRYGFSGYLENTEDNCELNIFYVNDKNSESFSFTGSFPKNEFEVALSTEAAAAIDNDEDLIGSYIKINGNDFLVTALVSEIAGKKIEEVYADDGYDSNALSDLVLISDKTLLSNAYTESIYMPGIGLIENGDIVYQATVYNDYNSSKNVTELVSGKMPEQQNEILVTLSYLNEQQKDSSDVIGKAFKLHDLYEEKYENTYWNMLNLYEICGNEIIVTGVVDLPGDFYLNPEVFDLIHNEYNRYYTYPYYVVLNEENMKNEMASLISTNTKILNSKYDLLYSFLDEINRIRTGFVVLAIVISLLTLMQMISLYSYSINDNKKEIGILRTIGVNKADTVRIYSLECVGVTVNSFVIACALVFIANIFLNNFINENIIEISEFNLLNLRGDIVVVSIIVSVILSLLSVIFPLMKYSKIKIVELIK